MHDTHGRPKPDHQRLFQIASEQGGYFTTSQAADCSFSKPLLAYHVKRHRFIRVRQGLYRLREYPSSPREDVIAAWLAAGREVAVVSHESALDMLDLSDVVPEVVHLTVPRSKRYRRASPGVAIHTRIRPFTSEDVTVRDGVRVTSPVRTIVDAAEEGTAPEEIIAAAIQAVERGMATEARLLAAARQRGARVERLVRRALEQRSAT